MKKLQKPIILFDIDGTLIDTKKLLRLRINHITRSVYNGKILRELSLGILFFLNTKQFATQSNVLKETFLSGEYISQSLYPDAQPVIQQLSKSYILGIWSQSITPYQIYKLQCMGLLQFFDAQRIYISLFKVWALNNMKIQTFHKHVYIVDNDMSKLKDLDDAVGTKLLVDRSKCHQNSTIQTIHSLIEIFSHIPHEIARVS